MHRGENEQLEEDAQGMGRRREGRRCAGEVWGRASLISCGKVRLTAGRRR